MQTRLYQLWDNKAEAVVGPILSVRSDAEALRLYSGLLANKDTLPGQYPADFDLLYLGQQNDLGAIEPVFPTQLARGDTLNLELLPNA